jgi:probable HAF family extracellular repeat protein
MELTKCFSFTAISNKHSYPTPMNRINNQNNKRLIPMKTLLKSIYFILVTLVMLGLANVPCLATPRYSITDLGTLGGTNSDGIGINNAGQVTGFSWTSSGEIHAFLYSNSLMQDLGTLGGTYSDGYGINNTGQVTGRAYTTGTTGDLALHAFLYSNGLMQDLGTLGGTYSDGYGINSAGLVTGQAYTSGDAASHAFLYSNGLMQSE